MVAKIEPDWIEPLSSLKNHFEPHWEKKRGQVVAYEQVTLYGLIVVGRPPVAPGPSTRRRRASCSSAKAWVWRDQQPCPRADSQPANLERRG
ncbi:hypothetical protein [Stutzerimonas stutzeri]|uniref:hypothetical protein n=1 Tax=Stutzerimonas stutzeri TaxID=316 RepID=UPI003EE20E0B